MRVNAECYQEGHQKYSLPLTTVNTIASNLIMEIRPTRNYKNSFQVLTHPPSQIFNPKLASLDLGTPSFVFPEIIPSDKCFNISLTQTLIKEVSLQPSKKSLVTKPNRI